MREAFSDAVVYSDDRELLASGIDIVDVVQSSYLPHEVASTAIKAEFHLLIEKPMYFIRRHLLRTKYKPTPMFHESG